MTKNETEATKAPVVIKPRRPRCSKPTILTSRFSVEGIILKFRAPRYRAARSLRWSKVRSL